MPASIPYAGTSANRSRVRRPGTAQCLLGHVTTCEISEAPFASARSGLTLQTGAPADSTGDGRMR